MKALVVAQAFPPLLKNAGGVAKRYLTLCRALIDGLGWQVALMTPVNVRQSKEEDVTRWLRDGSLVHLPARGVRIKSSSDGVAVFLDLFSFVNAGYLLKELCSVGGYDCVFADDVPWRFELLLLTRALGVPTVVSSHTDITHMESYKGIVKLVWTLHMLSTRLASVHATVSRIFGAQLKEKYSIPVDAIWPPILWASDFKSEPSLWIDAATELRQHWLKKFDEQGCKQPKAILLSAGRWSAEKRIHLLVEALPKDCALVIVGDGTSEYCKRILNSGLESGRPNVLPCRKMLNGKELRTAYAACDLFVSASNFETLGNTIIEAWCSGAPCAVQPAQGHLEHIKDQVNSWFVDYDNSDLARAALSRIVASGLTAEALRKSLPEFDSMGEKLRQADFAQEFDKAVLGPALTVGRQQAQGGLCSRGIEFAKRAVALILCLLLWGVIRFITRISFMVMRDPEMEVLGALGGAVDDKKGKSVWTLPCMRLFDSCSRELVDDSSADVGEDYESHFRSGRKRAGPILQEFQAGCGGPSSTPTSSGKRGRQ